jgi:hypothetical protein
MMVNMGILDQINLICHMFFAISTDSPSKQYAPLVERARIEHSCVHIVVPIESGPEHARL